MPFCGNCGHPLSDTDLTCPNCGQPQPQALPPEPTAEPLSSPVSEKSNLNPPQENLSQNTENGYDIPTEANNPSPEQPSFSSNYQQTTSYQQEPNTPPPSSPYQPSGGAPDSFGYSQSQNAYNPPTYPYTPTPNTPLTSNGGNGKGIAALILGICSIVFCFCYGFGLIPAIIGLILGILQVRKNSNGIAIAGIILSIVGILLSIAFLAYLIVAVSEASDAGLWDEFFSEFDSDFDSYYDTNSTL